MIAEYDLVYEGMNIKKGETIPELGSIKLTNVEQGIYTYMGLSRDESLLPNGRADIPHGSLFIAMDTKNGKYYESTTKRWY